MIGSAELTCNHSLALLPQHTGDKFMQVNYFARCPDSLKCEYCVASCVGSAFLIS